MPLIIQGADDTNKASKWGFYKPRLNATRGSPGPS